MDKNKINKSNKVYKTNKKIIKEISSYTKDLHKDQKECMNEILYCNHVLAVHPDSIEELKKQIQKSIFAISHLIKLLWNHYMRRNMKHKIHDPHFKMTIYPNSNISSDTIKKINATLYHPNPETIIHYSIAKEDKKFMGNLYAKDMSNGGKIREAAGIIKVYNGNKEMRAADGFYICETTDEVYQNSIFIDPKMLIAVFLGIIPISEYRSYYAKKLKYQKQLKENNLSEFTITTQQKEIELNNIYSSQNKLLFRTIMPDDIFYRIDEALEDIEHYDRYFSYRPGQKNEAIKKLINIRNSIQLEGDKLVLTEIITSSTNRLFGLLQLLDKRARAILLEDYISIDISASIHTFIYNLVMHKGKDFTTGIEKEVGLLRCYVDNKQEIRDEYKKALIHLIKLLEKDKKYPRSFHGNSLSVKELASKVKELLTAPMLSNRVIHLGNKSKCSVSNMDSFSSGLNDLIKTALDTTLTPSAEASKELLKSIAAIRKFDEMMVAFHTISKKLSKDIGKPIHLIYTKFEANYMKDFTQHIQDITGEVDMSSSIINLHDGIFIKGIPERLVLEIVAKQNELYKVNVEVNGIMVHHSRDDEEDEEGEGENKSNEEGEEGEGENKSSIVKKTSKSPKFSEPEFINIPRRRGESPYKSNYMQEPGRYITSNTQIRGKGIYLSSYELYESIIRDIKDTDYVDEIINFYNYLT